MKQGAHAPLHVVMTAIILWRLRVPVHVLCADVGCSIPWLYRVVRDYKLALRRPRLDYRMNVKEDAL